MYKHLTRVTDHKSILVTAAKNIRKELKINFPEVKFKVTTLRYSMGDNISVSWKNGCTVKEVNTIVSKYEQGTFNGMEDSYEYKQAQEEKEFITLYGSTKFLHLNRKINY